MNPSCNMPSSWILVKQNGAWIPANSMLCPIAQVATFRRGALPGQIDKFVSSANQGKKKCREEKKEGGEGRMCGRSAWRSAYLAKWVEGISQISLGNARSEAADVQGCDGRILWWRQVGHSVHAAQHLVRDGVIHTKVAVLDVLIGQLPSGGHLMPVRALSPTFALSPHKEGADRCSVPLQGRVSSFSTRGGHIRI